jgi:hypothetical protein
MILFNAVAMVDVDVDIKYSGVIFQQLEDCQDNVVHVAETRCSIAFGMVKSSRPTAC